jgi:hypothetical protein
VAAQQSAVETAGNEPAKPVAWLAVVPGLDVVLRQEAIGAHGVSAGPAKLF